MTLVQKVKANSSSWMKTQDESLLNFYWQDGYGGFSINPRQKNAVIDYIINQRKHHEKEAFQTEFRGFLRRYDMEWDERYVWD